MNAELLQSLVEGIEAGRAVAMVTCIASDDCCDWEVGQQCLVAEQSAVSEAGDLKLSPIHVEAVLDAIRDGHARTWRSKEPSATRELFIEVHAPPRHLLIVGAGHIAVPLARLGSLCDFRVTVLDDRPRYANAQRFPEADQVMAKDMLQALQELRRAGRLNPRTYIVLVTRGHQHDVDCLTEVLEDELAYIGMIGSKRRIRAVFELLQRERDLPRSLFSNVFAPIGLNIGAQTPAEIAVCIMSEIVNEYRNGPAVSFRDELQG